MTISANMMKSILNIIKWIIIWQKSSNITSKQASEGVPEAPEAPPKASSFSRCIGDRGNGDRKTCRTCDTKSKVSPPSWSLTTCRIEFKRSSLDNQRCVLCVTKNIAASFVWLRVVPATLVSETRKHHCQFWKNQLAPHWQKKDQATTAATEGETMWHLNCIQVWVISGGMWIVLLLNLSKSHLSTLSNTAVWNTAQFFNKTSYSALAVKLTILQAVILILHLLILLFRPILECMIVDDNALVRGIDSFELLQSWTTLFLAISQSAGIDGWNIRDSVLSAESGKWSDFRRWDHMASTSLSAEKPLGSRPVCWFTAAGRHHLSGLWVPYESIHSSSTNSAGGLGSLDTKTAI